MQPLPEYLERFSIDRAGNLVREVVPKRGQRYEHRCSKQAFAEIANAADELGAAGITIDKIIQRTGLPSTQVATALAFLKARGCVISEHRVSYPAQDNQTPGLLENDAMIEYYALAEGSPGSKQPDLPEVGPNESAPGT